MTPVVLLLLVAPLWIRCRATEHPMDCDDILTQSPTSASGVYTIYPFGERFPVNAFCDMDTFGGRWTAFCDMDTFGGRWTVFQRRMNGKVNFYRPWNEYVEGFGNADGEYWLGLEFLHRITETRKQELLVELGDNEGHIMYALYTFFHVGAECEGYMLNVTGFINRGAGNSLWYHNGMKFSTFDKDQDKWPGHHCALTNIGGFWYNVCYRANPNGLYNRNIIWREWKGHYSIPFVSMKTRPVVTEEHS